MKKLMLLATGGTIACTPTPNGLAPTLHAQDLANAVAPVIPCEIEARDVFMMDSSNMQPEEWSVLAQAIDQALAHCDGVVVTHKDGSTETIEADSVILSVGYNPAPLAKKSRRVHIVGDAAKVGNLRTVIWGAWDVCMKL